VSSDPDTPHLRQCNPCDRLTFSTRA
jgi:hypothetical protein